MLQKTPLLIGIIALLLSIGAASADVPPTALHFSGQLNTSGGNFTGTVNVTFAFYPTDSAQEVLWTDTLSTTVSNGRFHALLGTDANNLIPATAYVYDQLHLGVAVGTDNEMSPRIRVASVPFAQVANDANTLGGVAAADYASATDVASNAGQIINIQADYLTASSLSGYATENWVNAKGYLTSSALAGLASQSWVQGQGYLTATSLNGYATQSWVQAQDYASTGDASGGSAIGSNPFFGRQALGSKKSTSMTEITAFTPILAGNHITPTELKLEYDCNYAYQQNSYYKAQWRYRIDYADGSSYYATPSSGWVNCPYDYTTLLEVSIPPYDPCRGSITKIALEGDGYNSSVEMYGRITVTGFETAPTGLTACKPFIGRQASGSKKSTSMTEITSFSPISSGYNLTPTQIKLEYDCNYAYQQNSYYKAQWRYRIDYADGSSFYATPSSGWVNCPYDYTTLTHIQLIPHPNMTGRITKITLEGDGYNSSVEMYGRITVTGYEHAP